MTKFELLICSYSNQCSSPRFLTLFMSNSEHRTFLRLLTHRITKGFKRRNKTSNKIVFIIKKLHSEQLKTFLQLFWKNENSQSIWVSWLVWVALDCIDAWLIESGWKFQLETPPFLKQLETPPYLQTVTVKTLLGRINEEKITFNSSHSYIKMIHYERSDWNYQTTFKN